MKLTYKVKVHRKLKKHITGNGKHVAYRSLKRFANTYEKVSN